jgi:hypothetical protein
MRLGWFRPVHCKSMEAQGTRALPTARRLVKSNPRFRARLAPQTDKTCILPITIAEDLAPH